MVNVLKKAVGKEVLFVTSVVSFIAWYISYIQGLPTVYSDAMSHLNLSRFVVDNLQPGLTQIGGVWLPLSHLLPIPLIWHDWAWHSGFAGSVFSMLAFIVATWAMFKTVHLITNKLFPSYIAAFAFATNSNMLYLQTTPLTEPLYIGLFSLSIVFFVKWLKKNKTADLLFLGAIGFLQVLTRYDGWFVIGIVTILIGLYEYIVRKSVLTEVFAKMLIYVFPVLLGIGLWLLWNTLIFGSPLYFALGPYSAHAQQAYIDTKTPLLMKGSVYYSFWAYLLAMAANIGIAALALSFLGGINFLLQSTLSKTRKIIILVFLASPILFNILSLYLGFSILNLPELNWNPSNQPSGQWFNVRYGVLALPFVAILIGLLSYKRPLFIGIAILIVSLLQSINIYSNGVITVLDGTIGSSSYTHADVSDELARVISKDEKVLLSVSYFNAIAFRSNLHLSQIIHEGVNKQWKRAITQPTSYAKWIVMANNNIGDPLYTSLVINQKEQFLRHYDVHFKGKTATIYKIKKDTVVLR